jgi:hypothetical protein
MQLNMGTILSEPVSPYGGKILLSPPPPQSREDYDDLKRRIRTRSITEGAGSIFISLQRSALGLTIQPSLKVGNFK